MRNPYRAIRNYKKTIERLHERMADQEREVQRVRMREYQTMTLMFRAGAALGIVRSSIETDIEYRDRIEDLLNKHDS